MKNFKQNIPESFTKFKNKFMFAVDKANSSDTTIFTESINVADISDKLILEHYEYFVKNYKNHYDLAQDSIDKSKVLMTSITESYFQNNFNILLDAVLKSGTISIGMEYMLENTVNEFNLDLEKVGKNFLNPEAEISNVQPLEENIAGVMAGAGAFALGATGSQALIVSGVSAFGLSLVMPARHSNTMNQFINFLFGKIIGVVLNAGTIFTTRATPELAQSQSNIIKFDNIDADPSVKKLFISIQKLGANAKGVSSGLEAIIGECISNNKDIMNVEPSQKASLIEMFRGDFSPKNYNILKLLWKGVFGDSNASNGNFGTLIRFRKCLSNKLVDIYKLLLISNLENNRDHKRIMDNITKSNTRPEQILNFIHGDTDEDKKLKDAILALIQYRLYLTTMAEDLEKGFFSVDKEAGKYLKQKLSVVDGEVENYLRLNSNKVKNTFEGNMMSRKPVNAKRNLLSYNSNI